MRRRAGPASAGAKKAAAGVQPGVRPAGVRAVAAGEEWPELLGESPGVGLNELAE